MKFNNRRYTSRHAFAQQASRTNIELLNEVWYEVLPQNKGHPNYQKSKLKPPETPVFVK